MDLKKIQNESENLLKLSGENDISLISIEKMNNKNEFNSLIIILVSIFLGLSVGIFLAIVKNPLRNILEEAKNND